MKVAVINKNCIFLSNWFKVSLLLPLTLLGVCLEQARYLLRAQAQPPEKALRNRSIHLRSGLDFAFPAQVNPLFYNANIASPEFRSFFAPLIGFYLLINILIILPSIWLVDKSAKNKGKKDYLPRLVIYSILHLAGFLFYSPGSYFYSLSTKTASLSSLSVLLCMDFKCLFSI